MKQATNTKSVKFLESKPADFTGKVRERLQKLVKACRKAAEKDGLELEVKIKPIENTGSTHIQITSSTHYLNKGELGSDYFHVVLGERGGVRHAKQGNHITQNTKSLAYRKKAFQKLVRRIEGMN